ncbi:MAG: type II toxin-antitoxin system prevent-host-death family antitoxin [Deltaproteobacteria bacterium]|nr:type II toxin-antitoxin system prevent-host-death family antitoxin [Deltaproteobacteria bacterium]
MKNNELGVFEAKTHLSEIIRKVMAGQTFFVTMRGRRVAELRPVQEAKKPLARGAAKNADYFMAADFDAPIPGMEEVT